MGVLVAGIMARLPIQAGAATNMAHCREQLGTHFHQLLDPEQQAALARVRQALCESAKREQEHNKLLPQLPTAEEPPCK